MKLNNIEFPYDLIESIQNNSLVVFAGAGVSMGEPTKLPSFANLTRLIARNTPNRLGRRTDYEVFLGELKDGNGSGNGPDANQIAANIIAAKCSKPNSLHRSLVNLYQKPDDIKIVTTNYDLMFEAVFESNMINPKIYSIPALPLGNDISGLVHLHGTVENPKYIVLTDEDFGKAYLTDGYASRFLVQLFTHYDVLFVGYSFNDVVMRYLTKAMTRVSPRKKYILTDQEEPKWAQLGITPIQYPKGEHAQMTTAVTELGDKLRMDMLNWKSFFEDISDVPPKDLAKTSWISYCLKDIDKSRVMSQIIHGGLWVSFLDERYMFDSLFSDDANLSDVDLLWMNWLSKELVIEDQDVFIKLLSKHKSILNPEFSESMLRSIIFNEGLISDDSFKTMVILLKNYISEGYYLSPLLEIAYKRKMFSLYWQLYKKLFSVMMKCDRSYLLSEQYIITHSINTDPSTLIKYWKLVENDLVVTHCFSIIRFCIDYIEALHDEYVLINAADRENEPWKVSQYMLETDQLFQSFDGLYVFTKMFLVSSVKAQTINPHLLKGELIECLNSESIFLRKLALISIRETSVFSSARKMKLIVDSGLVISKPESQQTTRLICSIFDSLEDNKKDCLISFIMCDSRNEGVEYFRRAYSCLRAIKNKCCPYRLVEDRMKQLDAEYGFAALYNQTAPSNEKYINTKASELLRFEDSQLISLFSYISQKDSEFGIHDLISEISLAAEYSFDWAINSINILVNNNLYDEKVWNYLLYGTTKTQLSAEKYYYLLKLIAKPDVINDNCLSVSRVLFGLLRLNHIDDFFKYNEEHLFSIFKLLWKHKRIEFDNDDVKIQSLNTSLGILVMCCIIMIDLHKERKIPFDYKAIIQECLEMEGKEYNISLCIIVGNYGFLHYLEPQWCVSAFNPILSGMRSEEEYVCAWDGFVLFSGSLNTEFADDISSAFLLATKKMHLLHEDTRFRFIDLYITLLNNSIKNPRTKFIPHFFSEATAEDKRHFASRIGYLLERMESASKNKLWKRWLYKHLVDRTNNKPLQPIELELEEYLEWLPNLPNNYDVAVDVMCNGLLPEKIGYGFFQELIKSSLPNTNQKSTYKLLINLCAKSSKIPWNDGSVDAIVQMMDELTVEERRLLKNAFVENGWE